MAETTPVGEDERAARDRLRKLLGEVPAARPPAIPPVPKQRPRDWLDDILDSHPAPGPQPDPEPRRWWNATPARTEAEPDEEQPDEDEQPAKGPVFAPQPGYYPQPHTPAFIDRAQDRVALSHRTRKGLYNASAAGTGWALGLYQPLSHAIADCGQQAGASGALVLGIGGCLLIAHTWDRYTRHWWPPLAWCARIPLATALLALALWAPGAV
jgi:hypothetical protein